MQQGSLPEVELVKVVELFGHVPWTSLIAEQQHSSLAQLNRWHPDYGLESLMLRSFIVQISRMLPATCEVQKSVAKLSRQLDKLRAACPARSGGRQEFLKAIIEVAKRKRDDGEEALQMPLHHLSKRYFARHAAMWAKSEVRLQASFEKRARQSVVERQAELSGKLEMIEEQLGLMHDRHRAEDQTAPSICMSSAALTNRDLDQIARLKEDEGFSEPFVIQRLREVVMTTPSPWTADYIKNTLQKHNVVLPDEPGVPAWAKPIVKDRAFFEGCAISIQDEHVRGQLWKIVYIVQQPHYMAVCPLEELAMDVHSSDMHQGGRQEGCGLGEKTQVQLRKDLHSDGHATLAEGQCLVHASPAS